MRIFCVLGLFSYVLAQGQCTLTGSGLFYFADCSSQPGFVTLQIAGGTPPYAIQTDYGIQPPISVTGHWSSTFTQDLAGHLPSNGYSSWTVTDGMGCATSVLVWNIAVIPGLADVTPAYDCLAGTSSYRLQIFMSACGPSGGYTYSIVNSTTGQPAASGPLSALPTAGQGIFILPTLPNGSYQLLLSEGYNHCPLLGLYDCWQPVHFQVINVGAGDCGVNARIRTALDGPLIAPPLMNDDLRAGSLIPFSEPYSAWGYAYTGNPVITPIATGLLNVTGPDAIVDWMIVELRSNLGTVVCSKPVLLQRDGDLIDADGDPYVSFPIAPGNYHIALRHRNHLAVVSASAQPLFFEPHGSPYDFRVGSVSAYGTSPLRFKSGVLCLWAGDTTSDGVVKYVGANNDRDPILIAIGGSTPTNTVSNVYSPLDVNLDGVIKYVGANNDRDPILTTVGGSTPTNARVQQLP
jgi:hypothetical protein